MKENRQRKNYTAEFKNNAVAYFLKERCSISEAAVKFNITPGMLHKWLKGNRVQYEVDPNSANFLHRTVENLGKEVLQLKHDVDVLRNIVRKQLTDKVNSINEGDVVKSIAGE